MAEKVLTIEQLALAVQNVHFEFDRSKLPQQGERLLPMSGTIGKDGPLVFKVADRVKISPQSCKLKSHAANVDLELTDPQRIHVDEYLEIRLNYAVKDPLVEGSGKVVVQCNKESLIERTKEDLIMKDPSQHLQFTIVDPIGTVTFWVKHQKVTDAQTIQELKTLIVASIYYSTTETVTDQVLQLQCSKRIELKLPLVCPFRVASKCFTDSFRPMLATPPSHSPIINLAHIEVISDTAITVDRVEYCKSDHLAEQSGEALNCSDMTLVKTESCQVMFRLKLDGERVQVGQVGSVNVGAINIFWKRADSTVEDGTFVFTSSLGILPVSPPDAFPVQVQSTLPTIITQWSEFELKLKFRNDFGLQILIGCKSQNLSKKLVCDPISRHKVFAQLCTDRL